MTAVFSTFFRDALQASPNLLGDGVSTTASVKVRLFRDAPSFSANDARYTGITTVDGLLPLFGWSEIAAGTAGYPLSVTGTVSKRVYPLASDNNYIMLNEYKLTGLAYVEVRAAAYYFVGTVGAVVNPLIMVTDTPFNGQRVVVSSVDSLVSNPDATIVGTNRWLLSWATPGVGGVLSENEGLLALSRGAPLFEASHTQHVWLYPNRANMIANPSFERDTAFWLTNKALTRSAAPAPGGGGGYWSGSFANLTGLLDESGAALVAEDGLTLLSAEGALADDVALVAESNVFPTQGEERWTIQLMARGVGTLKVGFVWWDTNYEETAVDWGEETWTLDPVNFKHVSVARTAYQTNFAMIRLECSGSALTVDQVLVEKGYLKDWPYFDGDSTYGARDDYAWYGGVSRAGASYSTWYNNKRAVFGRLFSRDVGGVAVVTDEVMAEQGFVYQWVPAGTVVLPHIDVFYPNDLQLPLVMRPGTVLPYRANDLDLMGVVNPWL